MQTAAVQLLAVFMGAFCFHSLVSLMYTWPRVFMFMFACVCVCLSVFACVWVGGRFVRAIRADHPTGTCTLRPLRVFRYKRTYTHAHDARIHTQTRVRRLTTCVYIIIPVVTSHQVYEFTVSYESSDTNARIHTYDARIHTHTHAD